jgi:rubrerythrin
MGKAYTPDRMDSFTQKGFFLCSQLSKYQGGWSMDLATFGAIMTFALELEKQAAVFYEQAARGSLEDPFLDVARRANKRAKRIERTRREGIQEMILEPIRGMQGDDYRVELSSEGDESELLDRAIELVDTSIRFYLDAAEKIPVKEVARTCQRMAQESEKQKAELLRLQV